VSIAVEKSAVAFAVAGSVDFAALVLAVAFAVAGFFSCLCGCQFLLSS
jgi:hypothetical protein